MTREQLKNFRLKAQRLEDLLESINRYENMIEYLEKGRPVNLVGGEYGSIGLRLSQEISIKMAEVLKERLQTMRNEFDNA